jgi:hypothetical protein
VRGVYKACRGLLHFCSDRIHGGFRITTPDLAGHSVYLGLLASAVRPAE